MTAQRCREIIRKHARPLSPLPTPIQPSLREIEGVRTVVFDIYGTLVISGSGDVGTAQEETQLNAAVEALQAVGLSLADDGQAVVDGLQEAIVAAHAFRRELGVQYPEVEIDLIWQDLVARLAQTDSITESAASLDAQALAVHYEVRANPVWPMPHAAECLTRLRETGRVLGLISNAQFFTPELFPALFNASLTELGFDQQMRFYSYEHGQAKPGRFLYELAASQLQQRGFAPSEILYVGNDLLNDIRGARDLGFHTALFAGDARSLRLRKGIHALPAFKRISSLKIWRPYQPASSLYNQRLWNQPF